MNGDTVHLIERPYQEIVDDILTAMVGGVVNEPILFDVKSDLYPLAEPAAKIRGITGTRDQRRHTFLKEIDFLFSEGENAVVWQEGGDRPDDETPFYVDYFRREAGSPLTDINVGSVTRTLSEAIGREIATLYQQINQAYLSAFIDTATGKSLDFVVAILGVTRKSKDYAVGLATFFRDPQVTGNITIPEGVSLKVEKGDALFTVTQQRTLQRGQVRIDAPIRAGDEFKGEAGKVDAGKITAMARPIAGIARVTNFEPTFLGARDETDAELRSRAKSVLRALGKGTLAALARVIFEGRGELTEIWDPNSPPAKQAGPGSVALLVEAEPERFPSLVSAVHETRAAGVLATVVARYIYFTPRVRATIATGLTGAGKEKVQREIISSVQAYVDGLSAGDPAEGTRLIAAMTSVADVTAVTIADLMAWRSDTGDPGGEALSDALVAAVSGLPADDNEALRRAIDEVVAGPGSTAPTGRRIPDRSRVQGPSGERATDAEIEAGTFTVSAGFGGEPGWVVLDMTPADIVLEEG
jgi:hypothetical protein